MQAGVTVTARLPRSSPKLLTPSAAPTVQIPFTLTTSSYTHSHATHSYNDVEKVLLTNNVVVYGVALERDFWKKFFVVIPPVFRIITFFDPPVKHKMWWYSVP